MSSSGGARAAGSGMANEGKFRQRVDDHYKVMASAKKLIRIAGSMHTTTAVMLCTMSGLALKRWTAMNVEIDVGADSVGQGVKLVGFMSLVIMLIAVTCGMSAGHAAGAKDAEKYAASYATRLKMLAASLVIAGGTSAIAFKPPPLVEPPPESMLYAAIGFWGLAVLSAVIGLRGAGQLKSAFEQQKAKSKGK